MMKSSMMVEYNLYLWKQSIFYYKHVQTLILISDSNVWQLFLMKSLRNPYGFLK